MILEIAIIEDDAAAAEKLKSFIENYKNGGEMTFKVSVFGDALDFLENYRGQFYVIFMDIRLPMLNGLDAARKVRELNSDVLLIFVTTVASYAIEGYSVHAYDFLLKPYNLGSFTMMFDRVCKELMHKLDGTMITLPAKLDIKRVRILDILFVEVINHNLIFHFTDETTFCIRATMREYEKKLEPYNFIRCNACYLVNMLHITEVKGNTIAVRGHVLNISQSRRQAFMNAFTKYIGGSI